MGGGRKGDGGAGGCLTRTPYATLLALIMCWAGSAVFCGTMYRGVNLSLRVVQDVFHVDNSLEWVEPTQLAFVILGASMAAIAVMILVSSILATGATRVEVYRTQVGRVSGRVATATFIFLMSVCWSLLSSSLVLLLFSADTSC